MQPPNDSDLCCLHLAHVPLFAFSQVKSVGAVQRRLCTNAESPLSRMNKELLCRFDDNRGASVESCEDANELIATVREGQIVWKEAALARQN